MTDKIELNRIEGVSIQVARMYAGIALAELELIRPLDPDGDGVMHFEAGDELGAIQQDLMYFHGHTATDGYPVDHKIIEEEMEFVDTETHLLTALRATANALRAAKGTSGDAAANVSISDAPHRLRDIINDLDDEQSG